MFVAKPRSALVYITNQCNLDCRHCAPRAGVDVIEKTALMDADKLTTIIQRCHAAGIDYVSLTGGEPLLFKALPTVLQRTRAYGLKISINSNLTFLPKWIETLLAQGLIYEFCVSIDGAKAETHDRLRGKGNFDKTVSNIGRLKEMARRHGQPLKVSFTTVPTAYNFSELDDIVALAVKLGAEQIQFEHLGLSGNADLHADELVLDGQDLLDAYCAIMGHILSEHPPAVRSNMITNAFIEYYNALHGTDVSYKYFGCTSPQRFIYISYDGCVAPCSAMTDQIVGQSTGAHSQALDLMENALESIFDSAPMRDFVQQKTSIELQRQITPCGTCKFLGNFCSPCISQVLLGHEADFTLCRQSLSARSQLPQDRLLEAPS